jgi:hypothetical protein
MSDPDSAKKPLLTRRLVMEGLVIVASILLAFAIDAAWDERQERAQERRLLEALEDEFAAHPPVLLDAQVVHQRFANATFALFDTLDAAPEGEVVVVSDSLLYPIMRGRTTQLAQGELEAALSSGAIELIQNRELRRRLAAWPGVWEDATEEEGFGVQFQLGAFGESAGQASDIGRSLVDGLRGRGVTLDGPWRSEPRRITNTSWLRATLAQRAIIELGSAVGMEDARRAAEEIRRAIREELGMPPPPDSDEPGAGEAPGPDEGGTGGAGDNGSP